MFDVLESMPAVVWAGFPRRLAPCRAGASLAASLVRGGGGPAIGWLAGAPAGRTVLGPCEAGVRPARPTWRESDTRALLRPDRRSGRIPAHRQVLSPRLWTVVHLCVCRGWRTASVLQARFISVIEWQAGSRGLLIEDRNEGSATAVGRGSFPSATGSAGPPPLAHLTAQEKRGSES